MQLHVQLPLPALNYSEARIDLLTTELLRFTTPFRSVLPILLHLFSRNQKPLYHFSNRSTSFKNGTLRFQPRHPAPSIAEELDTDLDVETAG